MGIAYKKAPTSGAKTMEYNETQKGKRRKKNAILMQKYLSFVIHLCPIIE
jgi:hypothetical protein